MAVARRRRARLAALHQLLQPRVERLELGLRAPVHVKVSVNVNIHCACECEVARELLVGASSRWAACADIRAPLEHAVYLLLLTDYFLLAGGLRVRIRAPLEHARKLSAVTVGGQAWAAFSAAEETVDIPASERTARLIRQGLPRIVATFAQPQRKAQEPEAR